MFPIKHGRIISLPWFSYTFSSNVSFKLFLKTWAFLNVSLKHGFLLPLPQTWVSLTFPWNMGFLQKWVSFKHGFLVPFLRTWVTSHPELPVECCCHSQAEWSVAGTTLILIGQLLGPPSCWSLDCCNPFCNLLVNCYNHYQTDQLIDKSSRRLACKLLQLIWLVSRLLQSLPGWSFDCWCHVIDWSVGFNDDCQIVCWFLQTLPELLFAWHNHRRLISWSLQTVLCCHVAASLVACPRFD